MAHFWHLSKEGTHENFLERFNFTNGWKWHTLCKVRRWWRWCYRNVTVTIICWAMSIFISHFFPPKWAWKSAFHRNTWIAAASQRRRSRHWKLLGMKILIKQVKEIGLVPETMLRTQRSRPFPKPEKWLIFGNLAKGGPHEDFLESFIFTNGWKWYTLCKVKRWWRLCNGKVSVTIICWSMSIFISQNLPWKSAF